MSFVTAGSVEKSVERVMMRSYRGGHSASERLIREIYERSTKNLIAALDFSRACVESIRIYDNSGFDKPLQPLLNIHRGRPTWLTKEVSPWLEHLLKGTKFDLGNLRETLQQSTTRKAPGQSR